MGEIIEVDFEIGEQVATRPEWTTKDAPPPPLPLSKELYIPEGEWLYPYETTYGLENVGLFDPDAIYIDEE